MYNNLKKSTQERELTDFWGTVEPADQIWSDVIFRDMGGGTKITKLQVKFTLIHLLKKSIIRDIK